MESILESVKKMLGLEKEYTAFDPELIIYTNMALGVLTQLGAGPSGGFSITGYDETWSDYLPNDDPLSKRLEMIKTYIYMKVRLVFDPPNGSVLESFNKQISELEWRINVTVDPGDKTVEEIVSDDSYLKARENGLHILQSKSVEQEGWQNGQ